MHNPVQSHSIPYHYHSPHTVIIYHVSYHPLYHHTDTVIQLQISSYWVSLHLPEKHFPEKHFSEKPFPDRTTFQNVHLAKWTFSQKHIFRNKITLPQKSFLRKYILRKIIKLFIFFYFQ